jgi:putative ABC transport system permease protein
MAIRYGLLAEVFGMALDTVRTNKMRSALTVLGVVIGITSIVGMTSLIRGFDESLRDSIRTLGPDTIMVQRFGIVSFSSGKEFSELIKRPNLSQSDARALEEGVPSAEIVALWFGVGGPPTQERVFYRNNRTKQLPVFGVEETWADALRQAIDIGRFITGTEVQHRSRVILLGQQAYQALFPNGEDPVGKTVRLGAERYTVIGVFGKRPAIGNLNGGQDNFVVIPYTNYLKQFGIRTFNVGRRGSGGEMRAIIIVVVPRPGMRDRAMEEVRDTMRIRHGLKLTEADDFDLVTQDAALNAWEQISRATFFALVVISSIALMVGGIGVMAIMMISVTERTREIGVRKALGARRREILWQFLAEAAVLTSFGGVLGILFGAGIGALVHWLSGFPISLPWWSFAIGIGFSASVGIFFGMFPAVKASRLDPIEALRYE